MLANILEHSDEHERATRKLANDEIKHVEAELRQQKFHKKSVASSGKHRETTRSTISRT